MLPSELLMRPSPAQIPQVSPAMLLEKALTDGAGKIKGWPSAEDGYRIEAGWPPTWTT